MAYDPHSDWFRFAIYKLKVSQKQLAKQLRVSPSMLSRMMRGERGVDAAIWQSLAGMLSVPLDKYWKGPPV